MCLRHYIQSIILVAEYISLEQLIILNFHPLRWVLLKSFASQLG